MFQFVRTLNCLICGQMPAGAQQQVVNREKQWSSGSSKPPPHPPLALPPHSAGSEVCCFESHSHAPEGLLIPISDNGPQSLIIYSCPPVNNRTKQNKKKMIETDEKEGGKSKTFPPSEVSLPEHRCWPPRDDSHQNHNCLHCCHFLILAAQVFNFKIDLFQGRLSSRQRRREKAVAFFIKLLIAPQAKAASSGRQWDRKVRTKLPFHSYYYTMLCRIGHRSTHPDAQHNMDHSVYHLANIIR